MNFHTQLRKHVNKDVEMPVQNIIPRYKVSYSGTKYHTQVQNIIPRYKISYPGTKFLTQVKMSYPENKIFSLGMRYNEILTSDSRQIVIFWFISAAPKCTSGRCTA
jgi:hypothetical protein